MSDSNDSLSHITLSLPIDFAGKQPMSAEMKCQHFFDPVQYDD